MGRMSCQLGLVCPCPLPCGTAHPTTFVGSRSRAEPPKGSRKKLNKIIIIKKIKKKKKLLLVDPKIGSWVGSNGRDARTTHGYTHPHLTTCSFNKR